MRSEKLIIVTKDGPYVVRGSVPLVHKLQVVSEYGEPLTWRKGDPLEAGETYALCRCGQSRQWPLCDGTHVRIDFEGTETADTGVTADRQRVYPRGTHIEAKFDSHLCTRSGFCANRMGAIKDLVPGTADTSVRSQVIAMIERCPSGALSYAIEEGEPDIEPDLPQQVAVVTEVTTEGPITGPLWVTGGIPIERSDGELLETRNRVTLCGCGRSRRKPLCDGTHRRSGRDARTRSKARPLQRTHHLHS
jgi:CDGSH-type Zn-finger protein